VGIEEINNLPPVSGIYFAISEENILYVGKSACIQRRWLTHHRTKQLKSYKNVRVAWFECITTNEDELTELENLCIEHFKPSLNREDIPQEFSNGQTTMKVWKQTQEKVKLIAALAKVTMFEALDMLANETLEELQNKQ
jgi:hypothetical protein